MRSPGGRLTLWDKGKAGTQVYRSRKEARSGTTKESRGKAYVVGQREAGTQCTDLGWTVL